MHAQTLTPAALLALALLATPATAQGDACSQSDPCSWIVGVDADGFDRSDGMERNGTVGDWYVLDVFNYDDQAHTVTLEGHGVNLHMGPFGGTISDPFQLAQAGVFALDDEPSGDYLFVQVFETDVVAEEADATHTGNPDDPSQDKSQPLPIAAALGALLVAAVLMRRR